MYFRERHRSLQEKIIDLNDLIVGNPIQSKLAANESRVGRRDRTTSGAPRDSRHDFHDGYCRNKNLVAQRRVEKTGHPGRANFAYVAFHEGTAIREIVGHLTTFRNDRFGDGPALHLDEPSLSLSVVARRPDLLNQARSQERLMETFAFRRFRLRPKTRANRSFKVTQLVGF
jgi:hypothetical protein